MIWYAYLMHKWLWHNVLPGLVQPSEEPMERNICIP